MKLLRVWLLLSILPSSFAVAQHVELGAFANYSHIDHPNTVSNLVGAGGRINVNLARILQLEVESAYDFKYPHVTSVQQQNGITVNTSRLGIVHANAGLKVQSPGGSFFLFVKGGMNQYRTETQSQSVIATPPTIAIVQFPDRNFSKGILYPGGGIGFHAGPLGIRLDVGDEIAWINGSANHSLRVTFGPTFRF
jgi:hypothetical protein